MDIENKKRYNYMESALHDINRNYINISGSDNSAAAKIKSNIKCRNNKVLKAVLNQVIEKLKKENILFKHLFQRVFFGGSYYDGLRVGTPSEFDLDFLLQLPKGVCAQLIPSDIPGFMHLRLNEMQNFLRRPEAGNYAGLERFLNRNNNVMASEVSSWMESIFAKALNKFHQCDGKALINTGKGAYKASISKAGPAFTIHLNKNNTTIDVDLVPCFVFGKSQWPEAAIHLNPTKNYEFFIVPKKPHTNYTVDIDFYWRTAFQEQERSIIHNRNNLKPAAKLLKRLRDVLDQKAIASYYIKTIFLLETRNGNNLWNYSLSYVFMTMLKKLQWYLQNGIPYFWDNENNLIDHIDSITLQNFSNKLRSIIREIDENPQDASVALKYFK